MLAARWHIGTFQRRSAEWHRGLGIVAAIGGNNLGPTIMTGLPGSSRSKPQMALLSGLFCS